jgi:hypothetical protein
MFNNPDDSVYMFSPRQVGNDPTIDSDGPMSDVFHLEPFAPNTTIDAGLIRKDTPPQKAKLGDYVFEDLDQDGIQDSNERVLVGYKLNYKTPVVKP